MSDLSELAPDLTQPAGARPELRPSGRALKTSEVVARDLTAYIIKHRLPEGARLPTEREMVETLKVGRSTLREALRLLETRGVITIRSGRSGGPVVRWPRPTDLSEGLTLLLAFERASLSDVLHARLAVEPMIARLAAKRVTVDHLDRLHATIEQMLAHAGDQAIFLEQNRAFHSTIAEASGNTVLRIVNETLKSINDGASVGVQYSARRHRAVAAVHQRILEALEARDEERAEDEMRAHLLDMGRFWQARYARLFNMPVLWNDTRPRGGPAVQGVE